MQARAADRSSSGMLSLTGGESADFLQRLSTNDCSALVSGSAVQTVLTDEKGRVVDSIIAAHTGSSIFILTSPGRAAVVKQWLERFIIMEDIIVGDETGTRACAIVLAPTEVLDAVRASAIDIEGVPSPNQVMLFTFHSLNAALVLSQDASGLDRFLSSCGIPVMTPEEYDDLRIAFGIPERGREITEKTNPLEAGLRGQVDFTKGCYIGQEVIARLNTYEKVQRRLCRVRLSARPAQDEMPLEIIDQEGGHGYITTPGSAPDSEGGIPALAVIRSAKAVVGKQFTVNGITTTVEKVFQ